MSRWSPASLLASLQASITLYSPFTLLATFKELCRQTEIDPHTGLLMCNLVCNVVFEI